MFILTNWYPVTQRSGSVCDNTTQTIAWLGSLAVPMNVLLFICRADAVFLRSPKYRVLFGLLWFSTLVSFIIPFSITAAPIPILDQCFIERMDRTGVLGIAMVAVVDTVLFVAITARVARWYSPQLDLVSKCGRVSRILLLTGQLYYLWVTLFLRVQSILNATCLVYM